MTASVGAGQALTDGTGVSPLTWRKLLKDFIADALITAAAALATANVAGIPTDEQGWLVAATAALAPTRDSAALSGGARKRAAPEGVGAARG